jgi:transposase-like protein
VKRVKHDLNCPYCNADSRMVECNGTWCYCSSCSKTFIQREVGQLKKRQTDLGGNMFTEDGE